MLANEVAFPELFPVALTELLAEMLPVELACANP